MKTARNNRKTSITVCFTLMALAIFQTGYGQPFFYSQTLQKLYYSLPSTCRLENPVADTVASCTGILQDITVPVAYGVDSYGVLAHVGYRFLPFDMDTLLYSAVVRFMERETLTLLATPDLEQKLTANRENGLILLHNGNTPQRAFYRGRNGLPYLLQHVSGIDIHYNEGKRYHVILNCGTGQTLEFHFVADAELLSDMDKKERDDLIAMQLSHHRSISQESLRHVPACDESAMQVYRDSAFVCKGSAFIIPQINNDTYYRKNGNVYQPVFSRNWVAESFSNVMLASAERNYTVQVTQKMYGGQQRRYELNSLDFFDYFSGGYERYFGIESIERDILAGTLILADKNTGSIHLAFVSISLWDLFNGGAMNIRLDANIPQHNIETIFGKNRKK